MIGFSARLSFAFRCFFSLLFRGKIPPEILQALSSSTAQAPLATAARTTAVPEKSGADASDSDALDRAVQMLALLQRDGRLVDFLEEDISAYPDGQLGAAVRSIHSSCSHQTGGQCIRATADSWSVAPSRLARFPGHSTLIAAGVGSGDRGAGRN